jgi:predicted HTH domain antitoxin
MSRSLEAIAPPVSIVVNLEHLRYDGTPMQITVDLPPEIASHLGPNASRRVLETVLLDSYRQEHISVSRLGEILGISRWEAEEFIDKNRARLSYTLEMLDEDRRNIAKAFGKS